jgi:hypothetical protein
MINMQLSFLCTPQDIGGTKHAVVANPRRCTMCRECIRHTDHTKTSFGDEIKLRRVREHFIFSVETAGQYTAMHWVRQALLVLRAKAARPLAQLRNGGVGDVVAADVAARRLAAEDAAMDGDIDDAASSATGAAESSYTVASASARSAASSGNSVLQQHR